MFDVTRGTLGIALLFVSACGNKVEHKFGPLQLELETSCCQTQGVRKELVSFPESKVQCEWSGSSPIPGQTSAKDVWLGVSASCSSCGGSVSCQYNVEMNCAGQVDPHYCGDGGCPDDSQVVHCLVISELGKTRDCWLGMWGEGEPTCWVRLN